MYQHCRAGARPMLSDWQQTKSPFGMYDELKYEARLGRHITAKEAQTVGWFLRISYLWAGKSWCVAVHWVDSLNVPGVGQTHIYTFKTFKDLNVGYEHLRECLGLYVIHNVGSTPHRAPRVKKFDIEWFRNICCRVSLCLWSRPHRFAEIVFCAIPQCCPRRKWAHHIYAPIIFWCPVFRNGGLFWQKSARWFE